MFLLVSISSASVALPICWCLSSPSQLKYRFAHKPFINKPSIYRLSASSWHSCHLGGCLSMVCNGSASTGSRIRLATLHCSPASGVQPAIFFRPGPPQWQRAEFVATAPTQTGNVRHLFSSLRLSIEPRKIVNFPISLMVLCCFATPNSCPKVQQHEGKEHKPDAVVEFVLGLLIQYDMIHYMFLFRIYLLERQKFVT